MKVFEIGLFIVLGGLISACHSAGKYEEFAYVTVDQGKLKGRVDENRNVRSFKGIPYAAAPIRELRWKAPEPALPWDGTRVADRFGYKCMQNLMFSDMQFRDAGTNEDCLFLNVWAPNVENTTLPVLVYFYGGGFAAGDGSERRYDGTSMAAKGVVHVTVNYRLGVFGFFAHPKLSEGSGYGGSGNYAFMDQLAALKWVKRNISKFGGDPQRITIAGESAGSISVSALMASPQSKGLIAGAIGESGSLVDNIIVPLNIAEENGVALAQKLVPHEKNPIKALREMPANELLLKATNADFIWGLPTVDGNVLPKTPSELYAQTEYTMVPLLLGNNSQEGSYQHILKNDNVTVSNYKAALLKLYPNTHQKMFDLYPALSDDEVKDAAQAIASDKFISASTWNWANLVSKTSSVPVYYYRYDHVRPFMREAFWDKDYAQTPAYGAVHSAEIEYALGNLNTNNIYEWQEEDHQMSGILQQYFVNFVKNGNPNGSGLPEWQTFKNGKQLLISLTPKNEDIGYLHKRYKGLESIKR